MSYLYTDFLTNTPIIEDTDVYLRLHIQSGRHSAPLQNVSYSTQIVQTLTPLIPATYIDNGQFKVNTSDPNFCKLLDIGYISLENLISYNEKAGILCTNQLAKQDIYILATQKENISTLANKLHLSNVPQGDFSLDTFEQQLDEKLVEIEKLKELEDYEITWETVGRHDLMTTNLEYLCFVPIKFSITNPLLTRKSVRRIQIQQEFRCLIEESSDFRNYVLAHTILDLFIQEARLSLFPVTGLGSQSYYLDYHRIRVELLETNIKYAKIYSMDEDIFGCMLNCYDDVEALYKVGQAFFLEHNITPKNVADVQRALSRYASNQILNVIEQLYYKDKKL